MGLKVLERVQKVIEHELDSIGASKCSLPCLQTSQIWSQSQRLNSMKDSMFFVEGNDMVLAPTHEEEVTKLASRFVSSKFHLPLKLYQIGPKFRREQRPKGGLTRLREFVMKDMYSFDIDLKAATEAYDQARSAYDRIFKRICMPFEVVKASCGDMGGLMSHEYHLISEIGEDTLLKCTFCQLTFNSEVSEKFCSRCNGNELEKFKGLELGHTFLLGSKYADAFDAKIRDESGARIPLQMGCYGIGVTRLIAAVAEIHRDKFGLVWPKIISPFDMIVTGGQQMNAIGLDAINYRMFPFNDIAIDDRAHLTVSWRLKDAALIGAPYVVVIGNNFRQDHRIELYVRKYDLFERIDLQYSDLLSYLNNKNNE